MMVHEVRDNMVTALLQSYSFLHMYLLKGPMCYRVDSRMYPWEHLGFMLCPIFRKCQISRIKGLI